VSGSSISNRGRERTPNLGLLARRLVVGTAAAAGLAGIVADRPVLSVALRAGVVAAAGLVAIVLIERAATRLAPRARPTSRGGAR
jgi:hypothetical protein